MTLAAGEFIRRFLLHTLPDGFHRIRHYGFLANGHRAAKLALCRRLRDTPLQEPAADQAQDALLPLTKPERRLCCGGAMVILAPCHARRRIARRSGLTPRDAPAIRQHRSSITGRQSRPQGAYRSPTPCWLAAKPECRRSASAPRPRRTSDARFYPRRSRSAGRYRPTSQPMANIGPGAADIIPIASRPSRRFAQSGFNEVAILVYRLRAARPHGSLQIPKARGI